MSLMQRVHTLEQQLREREAVARFLALLVRPHDDRLVAQLERAHPWLVALPCDPPVPAADNPNEQVGEPSLR